MYKEATRTQMRVSTPKGNLSVEQLWTLTLPELDALAVSLEEQYKNTKGKSFLDKRSVADKKIKDQFDIVLDILQTKVEEAEIAKNAQEVKLHNAKIDALIAEKKDEELKGKTVKQLEALRK